MGSQPCALVGDTGSLALILSLARNTLIATLFPVWTPDWTK